MARMTTKAKHSRRVVNYAKTQREKGKIVRQPRKVLESFTISTVLGMYEALRDKPATLQDLGLDPIDGPPRFLIGFVDEHGEPLPDSCKINAKDLRYGYAVPVFAE